VDQHAARGSCPLERSRRTLGASFRTLRPTGIASIGVREHERDSQTTSSSPEQPMRGQTGTMGPEPDHGEESYRGSCKLSGKRAAPACPSGPSRVSRTLSTPFMERRARTAKHWLVRRSCASSSTKAQVACGVPADIKKPRSLRGNQSLSEPREAPSLVPRGRLRGEGRTGLGGLRLGPRPSPPFLGLGRPWSSR